MFKPLSNYQVILQRAGIVLLTIGALDMVYFLYRHSQGQPYSFSLNSLALVEGVFLLRGNLRAVPIVVWFSAFAIASSVSNLFILLPWSKPAELWVLEYRADPVSAVLWIGIQVVAIALLSWVYIQLRSTPVASISAQAGHPVDRSMFPFIIGLGYILILAAIMHATLGGAAGAKAIEVAEAQYGSHYKYHVTALRWADGSVSANLTAYNTQEMKPIQVKWKP